MEGHCLLGTLSNHNRNGNKDVTKKMLIAKQWLYIWIIFLDLEHNFLSYFPSNSSTTLAKPMLKGYFKTEQMMVNFHVSILTGMLSLLQLMDFRPQQKIEWHVVKWLKGVNSP